jgi:hypothetical protein
MFKLQTDRQSWLTVRLPDPDGEIRIKLRVKLLSHAENAAHKHQALTEQISRLQEEAASGVVDSAPALLAKFVAISDAISPDSIARDLDRIVERVTDWADVGDESGEPLSYTPDRMRSLLNIGTWVVKAVRQAITDLDDDGRRKN